MLTRAALVSTVAILIMAVLWFPSINPAAGGMAAGPTAGPVGYGGPTPTVTLISGLPVLSFTLGSTSTKNTQTSSFSSSSTSTSTSQLSTSSTATPTYTTTSGSTTSSSMTTTSSSTTTSGDFYVVATVDYYRSCYGCSYYALVAITNDDGYLHCLVCGTLTTNQTASGPMNCSYYVSYEVTDYSGAQSLVFQLKFANGTLIYSAGPTDSISGTWTPSCP
jgi:hypothetical protein